MVEQLGKTSLAEKKLADNSSTNNDRDAERVAWHFFNLEHLIYVCIYIYIHACDRNNSSRLTSFDQRGNDRLVNYPITIVHCRWYNIMPILDRTPYDNN